tara:strand:+ start:356 stop:754 length:399 start_codon:yes stop_codon:yes gene_type:complete
MVTKEEAEEYLAHYGVLGMKWGKSKEDRVSRKEAIKEVRAKVKASDYRYSDIRSSETKAKGKSSMNFAIGALGTWALGNLLLAKGNTTLAAGAAIAGNVLAGTAVVKGFQTKKSANTDALAKYGKDENGRNI